MSDSDSDESKNVKDWNSNGDVGERQVSPNLLSLVLQSPSGVSDKSVHLLVGAEETEDI